MSMKETKFYFEDMFLKEWCDTPVHFVGQDFDASAHAKWVNPVYKPLRSTSNGISGESSIELGQLYIVCWADVDVEVMELADDIITFIHANLDKLAYQARGYEIIDHGWDDTNKVFVVLSFTFEHFAGSCS